MICGFTQYNPAVYGCCDEQLKLILDTNATECCVNTGYSSLYDPTSHVCCNGLLVAIPLTHPSKTSCCGAYTLYDPDMEQCCGEDVASNTMECCDDREAFNPVSHVCCAGSIQPIHGVATTACCGMQSFDTRCNDCYDDVVILGYDEISQLCCDGVIHTKQYGYTCCCGTSILDASTSTCCNGAVVPKSPGDDSLCCREF